MKRIYYVCLACLAALFVSCASNPKLAGVDTPAVYVTNTKKVNILSTQNISVSMDEVQLFEGNFGDTSFSMPVYIQADESSLYISMLNDVGTSLGELTFSGNKVDFESSVMPKNLKAEYIVWDIQLVWYDPESIRERLSHYKLSFDVSSDGTTETRKIIDGSKVIEEISIKKNYVVIKNLLRGYEYHLTGVGDE